MYRVYFNGAVRFKGSLVQCDQFARALAKEPGAKKIWIVPAWRCADGSLR